MKVQVSSSVFINKGMVMSWAVQGRGERGISRLVQGRDRMVISWSSNDRVEQGSDRMVMCCSNRVEQGGDRMLMSRSSSKRVEQYVYQQGTPPLNMAQV